MDKDMQRIRTLTTEKNKLRDLVENMKMQINEKEKEIVGLKEKVNNLRKNNQLLQSQLNVKNEQEG
jgi:regulator of replication initiation timing